MNGDEQDDDIDLFREAIGDVEPLKPSNKVRHAPVRKKFRRPQEQQLDYATDQAYSDAPVAPAPDVLSFYRSGLQSATMKRLRTGKTPIDATLDLHGHTVDEARIALLEFFDACAGTDIRCARIVHGKGYSSPNNQPVIKAYLDRWLRETDAVLAFHTAIPKDGGTGAVYVLLKRAD